MAEYSQMRVLDVWYASIDLEKTDRHDQGRAKRASAFRSDWRRPALAASLEHDFPKLADMAGQAPTIKDNPPLIYHPRDEGGEDLLSRTRAAFGDYRQSMQEDRRVLLDRYELKDIAMKVVGVGSVGTFCAVMLLMASDRTRCSSRSRRPAHRCWRPMPARASMPIMASGS